MMAGPFCFGTENHGTGAGRVIMIEAGRLGDRRADFRKKTGREESPDTAGQRAW